MLPIPTLNAPEKSGAFLGAKPPKRANSAPYMWQPSGNRIMEKRERAKQIIPQMFFQSMSHHWPPWTPTSLSVHVSTPSSSLSMIPLGISWDLKICREGLWDCYAKSVNWGTCATTFGTCRRETIETIGVVSFLLGGCPDRAKALCGTTSMTARIWPCVTESPQHLNSSLTDQWDLCLRDGSQTVGGLGTVRRRQQTGWKAEVVGESTMVVFFNTLVNRALGGERSQYPKPLEANYTHTHTNNFSALGKI